MGVIALVIAVEGTFGIKLHVSIPFYALVLALQACLELTLLDRLRRNREVSASNAAFLLAHGGLLLVVWAAFFGAPDHVEGDVWTDTRSSVGTARTADGNPIALPFSIALDSLVIETYSDGVSTKQYTSVLDLTDLEDGTLRHIETSVNHPCAYRGFRIYQKDCDMEFGDYTILMLARDPWLPAVYLGMLLLALGSALSLAGRFRLKVLIPAIAVLAVVFAIASVARISFGTLPPALRSLWFIPHLIVYMVAYSAMAMAVVLALVSMASTRRSESLKDSSERMVRVSSVLLLFGMIFGSIWAKQAWGDYWAWDPKECWAAVTWLLTQVYLHILPARRKAGALVLATLLLAFLALQTTWYGVNYLPSARESMHTYN